MMRRLIVAAAAALLGVVLLSAPAYAEQTSVTCKDWAGVFGTHYSLCITTVWRNQAGSTGITVFSIETQASGGPWEENAFDCDAIRLWNDNDVVKWRKDGVLCDLKSSDARDLWWVNGPDGLSLPSTNTVSISLAGYPHFNNNADPGRTVLTQTLRD